MFKIGFYLLLLCSSILNVYGEGELVIFSSPKAIKFSGHDEIPSSSLKDVFSASLGYSVEQENSWNGMQIKKPFGFPEALLVFHLVGINSLESNRVPSFRIMPDGDSMDDTYDALWQRTMQRHSNGFPQLRKYIVDEKIKEVSGSLVTEVEVSETGPVQSISSQGPISNSEHDQMFIKELNKLLAVGNQALKKEHKDGVPDVYWIKSNRLGEVMKLRGGNSNEIVLNAIMTLTQRASKVYNEKVIVAAVTEGEESHSDRIKREATSSYTPPVPKNIADDYSEDFPVIFNIILWFSIAFLFSLIAISMVIAGMDPGRDSIIYRMTSTRMKKDN